MEVGYEERRGGQHGRGLVRVPTGDVGEAPGRLQHRLRTAHPKLEGRPQERHSSRLHCDIHLEHKGIWSRKSRRREAGRGGVCTSYDTDIKIIID